MEGPITWKEKLHKLGMVGLQKQGSGNQQKPDPRYPGTFHSPGRAHTAHKLTSASV